MINNYNREGAGIQFIGLTPPHFNAVDIPMIIVSQKPHNENFTPALSL
jgi:hypothetical protein